MDCLSKNQKETIGLLQLGTFLEYFDLMLYVHMAVLLNDVFFPKTDVKTGSLLAGIAFCSTYALRPFGALLFGYIGDRIGRKITLIITTTMMAVSCLVMAVLPTYAQIGITAAWIVSICRITQGLSSMGEIIGAEIYLMESFKPPKQYPIVALLGVMASLGPCAALGVATLITSFGFNWRWAFCFGAIIALIASRARVSLRETPEFLMMRSQQKIQQESNQKKEPSELEKKTGKTLFFYLLTMCGWPLFFYFTYIHCGQILSNQYGYTPFDIIHHNFVVSIFQLSNLILFWYLSSKVYPLKLIRFRLYGALFFILIYIFIFPQVSSPLQVGMLQVVCIFSAPNNIPAIPIFYKYIPTLSRFVGASTMYALSRALVYFVTVFGCVYLTDYFGHLGLLLVFVPVIFGFWRALLYFENLEKKYNYSTNPTLISVP